MMSGRGNRYPFTPSQWQELEHQALIYKYMESGIPIPSDLILPIRRSFLLDSSLTSPSLGFTQPSLGWGVYQMGFPRKAEDPEPGRCRRTDGKKWRCSKEAYPDSKYCEKHMHRGKNRSRKPVEMPLATSNSNPNISAVSSTSSSRTPSPYPSSLSISTPQPYNHLLYSNQISSNSSHFQSASPYYSERDYRYTHGVRELEEQQGFYTDSSTGERDNCSWQFKPLGINGSLQQQQQQHQSSCIPNFFSSKEEGDKSHHNQQHCFLLGADLKLEKPGRETDGEKPLRHFFDEWPQKKDPWMDLEEAYSKTQLSISIPMTHHDFNA